MRSKANHSYFKRGFQAVMVIAIILFVASSGYAYGQGAYKMTQKELHKFKVAKSHHYAGQQAYVKKKYDKALKSFKKCVETMPEYSSAYYFMAKIYYHKGDLNLAQSNIKLAKKHYKFMNDMMINSRLEYHQTLRRQRDDMQKDLSNSTLRLSTTDRATMEKKIGQIDSILNKPVVDVDRMPADYFYLHGNIYFKVKKLKEAHDQYVEALRADPAHEATYNNLISLYLAIKRADKASEYCHKAESNGVKLNNKLLTAVKKANGK